MIQSHDTVVDVYFLHVHGNRLWSCWEGHLTHHTIPEQALDWLQTSVITENN